MMFLRSNQLGGGTAKHSRERKEPSGEALGVVDVGDKTGKHTNGVESGKHTNGGESHSKGGAV